MSIGDLKTDGNKGNNFPWQLKMLLGQQCACDELAAINANTDDVEFLLTAILTTLQANTEYEAKFVVDTCDSDKVYLEVRVWNPDTSTWGPITYYLPGSDTPVIPVGASTPGCLIYTDPSGILGMILAELQLQTPILTNIEINTGDTVTELQSILALYSAGPQACADSLSVTLCTEQGTSLSNIETNTTGLATEVTLDNIYTELQGGITVDAIALDIRPLVCTDEVSLCANGNTVDSSNPLPVDAGALTPSADGVGMYGSTDGGINWTAVQVDTNGVVSTNSNIVGPLGPQLCVDSVAVTLCQDQAQVYVTPILLASTTLLNPTGNLTAYAGTQILSISFASNGTADADISVDGGVNYLKLAPGMTINLDANGIMNYYNPNLFYWDTSITAGASLLIAFNFV